MVIKTIRNQILYIKIKLCTSTNTTILVNCYIYNITRLMREILYLSKNADHETKVPLSCGGDPSQPGEPTRLTETTLRWHPYLEAQHLPTVELSVPWQTYHCKKTTLILRTEIRCATRLTFKVLQYNQLRLHITLYYCFLN